MAGVPFIFGNATTSIPLTNLDANFNTGVTIGNTTVGLGNTVTTLGNVTLTNATLPGATGITQIANGTSNVSISSSGGNINVVTAGTIATFPAATGTVMVSGNIPTFQAYVASTQAITGGVWTKLALTGKEWDTSSAFDAVTNYRYTPLVAGYYQVNASCPSVGTASGANNIAIYKNGSLYKVNALATNGLPSISCMFNLNGSTDYLECYVNYGASQNISASGNNFMSACLVRAA